MYMYRARNGGGPRTCELFFALELCPDVREFLVDTRALSLFIRGAADVSDKHGQAAHGARCAGHFECELRNPTTFNLVLLLHTQLPALSLSLSLSLGGFVHHHTVSLPPCFDGAPPPK